MKARVKATGEIVEVTKDYDLRESTVVEFYTNIEDPTDVFEKEDLEFPYDSEFIDYWTRLKHNVAINALGSFILTNNIKNGDLEGMRECITNAMAIAHALVEKYKENEKAMH